jgi:hypothetical protein
MDSKTVKAIVQQTLTASRTTEFEDKARARKAAATLGDQTDEDKAFVYNGFLNLIARGVAPTEANILAESRKLATANRLHFEALNERMRRKQPA